MRIGFHLTPFFSPAERSPTQIIDEVAQVVRAASGMGYAWVSAPHHWLAHPTAWPQPYPLLARLLRIWHHAPQDVRLTPAAAQSSRSG
jgi:hypothetical protein